MKKLLYGLAFISLLISCNKQTEFDLFEKKFSKSIELKGNIQPINSNLLGDPTDLRICDSLLIFIDPDKNYHLRAISKEKMDRDFKFLNVGRGPNEYGLIRGIEIDKSNNICFFDDIVNTYYELKPDLNVKSITPQAVVLMKLNSGKILNTARIGDQFISTGIFKNSGRFLISKINQSNKEIDSSEIFIGKYPVDSHQDISNLTKGMAYQTRLMKDYLGQTVIAFSLMAGDITFFHKTNEEITPIKNFLFHIPNYTPETKGYAVTFSSESTIGFLDACFFDKYVFALYSGKSIKEFGSTAFLGNKIFVFSLNGMPKAEFRLDHNIRSLDVDEREKAIYGITITPYPQIVKFNFDKDEL